MSKSSVAVRAKGANEKKAAVATLEPVEAAPPPPTVVEEAVASVVRAFTKSGNIPWRRKYYHLDQAKYDAVVADKSVGHLAPQAQLTLRWMSMNGVTEPGAALDGPTIQARAVASGMVRTVIKPAPLFAYYRRAMEQYGLVFTGYDVTDAGNTADE